MSPILVTFTSHSDSNFRRSNIGFKENQPDGVDQKSDGFYYYFQKKEGRKNSTVFGRLLSVDKKLSGRPLKSMNLTEYDTNPLVVSSICKITSTLRLKDRFQNATPLMTHLGK